MCARFRRPWRRFGSLSCRSRGAAEESTHDAPSPNVFRRRKPRANRQCLVSQSGNGDEAAGGDACEAAPAGPGDRRESPGAARRRASGGAKTGVRTAVEGPARSRGVPSLGCSKCRHAPRGCGKCRQDRLTALKVLVIPCCRADTLNHL